MRTKRRTKKCDVVPDAAWSLRYGEFVPEREGVREALCALGNGYFCTRGAAEEVEPDDVHYPGTYLAGGYDRMKTEIADRIVENEDLVNFPNWLRLTFRIESGVWFNLRGVDVLDYVQELRMRDGVLSRRVRYRDRDDRITRIESRRIVHMRQQHRAAIELRITPENWSGCIDIHSALDGRVVNANVERYSTLRGDHLEPIAHGDDDDAIWLLVRTKQSRIAMAQAALTHIFRGDEPVDAERRIVNEPGFIAHELTVDAHQGETLTIEKSAAVFTSRDWAISEPLLEAREAIAAHRRFDDLLETHAQAWHHLWRRFDMVLEARHERMEMILRLHIFHLLQTVSVHTIDLDFGVPARGLHGEAYRGHVFWDELFIFPLLNLRLPELTRALLMYRYRRLGQARVLAGAEGFRGALYPWQSGSNGREETQQLHLNPRSGRWLPDHTHLQRHVNAAVAYNVWQYVQATGDLEFLAWYGAEMILEIARFWASAATWSDEHSRYDIRSVVGPDEYHEGYPDCEKPGLNNNAYTNVMAVWTLTCALECLDRLDAERRQELCETLALMDDEIHRWRDISTKMRICFHNDVSSSLSGDAQRSARHAAVISQFEGYEDLEELDWDAYRRTHDDLHRLDRILESEGDSANRYKVSKQADVLMLFYVFSFDELKAIFNRLGYELDDDAAQRNIDYYMRRTDHGSTLSRVVHSWVMARYGCRYPGSPSRQSTTAGDGESQQSPGEHDSRFGEPGYHAWQLFCEALESDVSDIQGGTTAEGIHLGAMAGTVDLVQRCFAGVRIEDESLRLDPAMPDDLRCVRMRLQFRGNWLELEVNHKEARIRAFESAAQPLTIAFRNERRRLRPGATLRFRLDGDQSRGRQGVK